ncbi:MAG: hypothetical protein RIS88_892 [Pseudomonadota bacterium]|jgi:uncharacterized protein
MKYLVLVAILAVVYLLWRAQQRRQDAASARSSERPPAPPPADPTLPQDMVRCPVCAVHLPRNEAVADPQGRLYCSPEHRASGDR